MDKQFTASEVREYAKYDDSPEREMLNSFADLLEAQEKAVPVAYAAGLEANMRGFLDVMAWSEGEFTIPLYTHVAPSDAERLAEALERTARHRAAADHIDPDQWRSVLYSWEDRALAAHSAQAQPPAASVTDASGALRFAWKVLDASRESLADVGGDSIQDWAVECGLLEPTIVPSDAPDSERCYWCEGGECECFRYTKLALACQSLLAAQENPNG